MVADIPGLIEGAAEGAGLGIQFLKHLQRTGLLLHMVELPAYEEMPSPVEQMKALEHELEKFSNELQGKERWLVFTKADLMPTDVIKLKVAGYTKELNWKGPVFVISSISRTGLSDLNQHIANYLSKSNEDIWD
ncbi:MAG: 50S ribosome-binding GTPase [Alcanivoracaceae bacterium]|nr:50S ribosome-binding GTPase [Alcanivoracaceae bacterium]